jgi:leader peptidase (prepilin peptidase)/N-methyltransferase
MPLIIYIAVCILGLALGSFLNVVIYRLPKGLSLMGPRSQCPSCQAKIHFYDNIPVISFLLLRGRCRQCDAPISWRYPLVELLTGLLMIFMLLRFGLNINFVKYSLLTLILIPVTFIDIDEKIIPNWLTFSGLIGGVTITLIFQIELWRFMLQGMVAGGLFMALLMVLGKWLLKKEAMGMGDLKLLAMIGIYVGITGALLSVYIGAMIAFILIVIQLLSRRINLKETIPFGPFIAVGALVYIMIGSELIFWYRNLVT